MNNAISIYNLEKIVYQNQFYFIDIRESYQYDQLHIYNFENIPYDILINKLDYLPKDKPLCLICYSGERTKRLSRELQQKGYRAYYVEGGLQAFLNMHNEKYF